jgi:hypothetical protein
MIADLTFNSSGATLQVRLPEIDTDSIWTSAKALHPVGEFLSSAMAVGSTVNFSLHDYNTSQSFWKALRRVLQNLSILLETNRFDEVLTILNLPSSKDLLDLDKNALEHAQKKKDWLQGDLTGKIFSEIQRIDKPGIYQLSFSRGKKKTGAAQIWIPGSPLLESTQEPYVSAPRLMGDRNRNIDILFDMIAHAAKEKKFTEMLIAELEKEQEWKKLLTAFPHFQLERLNITPGKPFATFDIEEGTIACTSKPEKGGTVLSVTAVLRKIK